MKGLINICFVLLFVFVCLFVCVHVCERVQHAVQHTETTETILKEIKTARQ